MRSAGESPKRTTSTSCARFIPEFRSTLASAGECTPGARQREARSGGARDVIEVTGPGLESPDRIRPRLSKLCFVRPLPSHQPPLPSARLCFRSFAACAPRCLRPNALLAPLLRLLTRDFTPVCRVSRMYARRSGRTPALFLAAAWHRGLHQRCACTSYSCPRPRSLVLTHARSVSTARLACIPCALASEAPVLPLQPCLLPSPCRADRRTHPAEVLVVMLRDVTQHCLVDSRGHFSAPVLTSKCATPCVSTATAPSR
jgi:hypothetical protein